jgi:hypothetical protein
LNPSSVSQPLAFTSTNSTIPPLDSQSFLVPTSTSPSPSQTIANGRLSFAGNTVCLGNGLDASVDGLLATIVLFGLIGLLLWVRSTLSLHTFPATSDASQLLFALIRPRCRQIYGLREWFVQERCVRVTSPRPLVLILPKKPPCTAAPHLVGISKPSRTHGTLHIRHPLESQRACRTRRV